MDFDPALLARLPVDTATFLVLFCRLGAVFMLLPAFSEDSVPPNIRLLLSLGMTLGLYGMLEGRIAPVAGNEASLPMLVVSELLVGLALGAIIRILFSAAVVAGSVVTQQIGLGAAAVFDPSQGGQSALLARFFGLAAVLVCMSLGVHHMWIASIVKSYDAFPVGGFPPAADFAQLAVRVLGEAFSLGLSLAAPLILYGALFNLGLGLAARVAPTIQVFFITQPLNIMLGVSLTALTIGAMLTAFATAMADFMRSGWSI